MDRSGIAYIADLASSEVVRRDVFKLDAMRAAMAALGNPQDALRTVHVGGTNGKGSVSATIAAILGRSGYRVGLTTSPHLRSVNERLVVDGYPISNERLDLLARKVRATLDAAGVTLTFFEFTTACAFVHFVEERVDYAVIEVGLGGRLDATNVIAMPDVAVVVSIDYDHQDILGSTLTQIAREKAGIVKAGAKLVLGRVGPEAERELLAAGETRALSVALLGRDYDVESERAGSGVLSFQGSSDIIRLQPALAGEHQLHNAAVACAAARAIGISSKDCEDGVASVFWPGRLEEISLRGRRILLDSAHNPAGIRVLCSYLQQSGLMELDIVFGALTTKSWLEMIKMLQPFAASWTLLVPANPKALAIAELRAALSGNQVSIRDFDGDYDGFIASLDVDSSQRPLLVCGSMYMMGKIRERLVHGERALWTRRGSEIRTAA